jgi:hypothetical protein
MKTFLNHPTNGSTFFPQGLQKQKLPQDVDFAGVFVSD